MLQQLLAIIRNTFFESIRQPIMLVVLIIATIALIMANPLSAFTMKDDQRMLIDMGLATIFLCGTLMASFVATNVLGREIENRTALTIIAKPVSRPLFVVGKYIGVSLALVLGTLYMVFVFLLVEQHRVLQTVRDPVHLPVLAFGLSAGALGLAVGIWCNYFYNRVFASTVICVTTPLAGIAYLLSMMFKHDFTPQSIAVGFNSQLWLASFTLIVAILVLTAIAVAASTRLGQVMTLCVTLGVFMFGMLSDYVLGRTIENIRRDLIVEARSQGKTQMVEREQVIDFVREQPQRVVRLEEVATVPLLSFADTSTRAAYVSANVAYAIVPNFQVLWLTDAVTQGHRIPTEYIVRSTAYGTLHIIAALALATMLFQRREVG